MEISSNSPVTALTSFINSGVFSFLFSCLPNSKDNYLYNRRLNRKKNFDTTHGHKVHICVHDWIQITYSVTRSIHEVSWNITRKPAFRLFTVWIPRSLHFLEDMSAKTTQDAKQWMSDQLPCLFHGRKIQHYPSLGDAWTRILQIPFSI